MIGIDVVKLAIRAKSHAGSHGNEPLAPKRTEKLHIHFGEVADESQAAFAFVDLHRLGQKARGIACANAHGRLARQRNRSRELLIEQAGEHHDGGIARLAIGDAQTVHEAAGDAHARERGGENLAAAVDHQNFVARARHFGDLPRDRLHVFIAFEQRARNFDHQSHSNPAVSGYPRIPFRFCTACPAAPLPRLSRHDTTIKRSPDASSAKPISQKFVCATCCSSGNFPPA